MRRTTTLLIVAALGLAACGGSDGDSSTTDDSATESDTADTGDTGSGEGSESGEGDDAEPADDTETADDTGDDLPAAEESEVEKPEVEVPGEAPAELVRSVLIDGTGVEAADGDTVVVDYIGVRSLDGVEFDNSYDRGQPFPVVLGSGGVIQGWDDGLVGARAGDRLQLDIPSDLAYGETARSDVIRENEPLTFVIDVRAVIPATDPADAPTEIGVELSEGEGVATTEFTDLVEGEGKTLEFGDSAAIHFNYYRGDNGVLLDTSWESQPLTLQFIEGQLLPGLATGLDGMKVGGRRAIVIPPEEGFGPQGSPQEGLPADTDIIFVIDLLAAY